MKRRVVVLGSTGSIGTNCLDVIGALPDRLTALGLSAHESWDAVVKQAHQHRPRWVALTDPDAARRADPGSCRRVQTSCAAPTASPAW